MSKDLSCLQKVECINNAKTCKSLICSYNVSKKNKKEAKHAISVIMKDVKTMP